MAKPTKDEIRAFKQRVQQKESVPELIPILNPDPDKSYALAAISGKNPFNVEAAKAQGYEVVNKINNSGEVLLNGVQPDPNMGAVTTEDCVLMSIPKEFREILNEHNQNEVRRATNGTIEELNETLKEHGGTTHTSLPKVIKPKNIMSEEDRKKALIPKKTIASSDDEIEEEIS